MHQRVTIDNLRGMDATTLELMVGDSLRRPLAQFVPPTMADLIALSEVDKPPGALRTALRKFRERVPRDIADIPDGGEFEQFVATLRELPAAMVPKTLRDALATESERIGRTQATRDLALELLASWSDVEPEPFVIGEGAPAIAQPAVAPKTSRAASSRAKSATPRRTRAPKLIDPERESFLVQLCIDRMQAHPERGLAENVLAVGITHKARSRYPDVLGKEVLDVLKVLEGRGVARRTAGRWILERRW